MHKQMVGIRERAERLARSRGAAAPQTSPVYRPDPVIEPELAATGV
jgi:hypothetical protein